MTDRRSVGPGVIAPQHAPSVNDAAKRPPSAAAAPAQNNAARVDVQPKRTTSSAPDNRGMERNTSSEDLTKEESGGRRKRAALLSYYGIEENAPSDATGVPPAAAASVPATAAEGAKHQVNEPPNNIDGASFDPNRHFQKLLRDNTLAQLVQCDNQLVSKIKELDSDMKTLVYENYNKFISATETIKTMKTNVENMSEEMAKLSENMEKISTWSDQINNTLASRRDKIQQLASVHRLLKNLQLLVDMPSRLKKSVELEAYSRAVHYYVTSSEILRRYDNLPSFKTIGQECEQIIAQLRTRLKTKLHDTKAAAPEVTEAVSLLLELHEPAASLREQYLASRRTHLQDDVLQPVLASLSLLSLMPSASMNTQVPTGAGQATLKPASTTSSTPTAAAARQAISSASALVATAPVIPMETQLRQLNRAFLQDFLECAKCFRILFIDRDGVTALNRKEAAKQLDEFAKFLFGLYFPAVHAILTAASNSSATSSSSVAATTTTPTPSSKDILEALRIFNKDISQVHAQVPELQIAEKASDVMNNIVQHQFEVSFNSLQNKAKAYIQNLGVSGSGSGTAVPLQPQQMCKEAAFLIVADASNMLDDLKLFLVGTTSSNNTQQQQPHQPLADASTNNNPAAPASPSAPTTASAPSFLSKHCVVFLSRLHVKMQQFLLFVIILLQEYYEENSGPSISAATGLQQPPLPFLLLLGRLCLYLYAEGGTVDQLAATLAKLRQEVAIANQSQSKSINDINVNTSDLRNRFKVSAECLVSHYMKMQSGKISSVISKSLDTAPSVKDKGPRAGMETFLDEIKIMAADLSGVFDFGGGPSSATGGSDATATVPTVDFVPATAAAKPGTAAAVAQQPQSSGMKTTATVAATHNPQQATTSKALFEKKIALSSEVMEFSKSSILTDIAKICIKAFVEFVRLKTFNKVAFQQVQVDVYFLRIALGNFVSTKGIVGLLLDEVVTSATDRSTDPVSMEQSSMWMLCEPKLEKYKTQKP